MHHRECAIANGYPSAGAHCQGNELTSLQGGIPRKEHQCIIEEVHERDSAKANGWDPSTSAHRPPLQNRRGVTSQQQGIPQREHQCLIEESSQRDTAIANGDPPTGARRLDDMHTPHQGGLPWKERQCIIGGDFFKFIFAYPSARSHYVNDMPMYHRGRFLFKFIFAYPSGHEAFPAGNANASLRKIFSNSFSIFKGRVVL